MEIQNFEKNLAEMTKPEMVRLKHQDMLVQAITNAKDKSAVSWWWLSVPLYIVCMLLMKNIYVPNSDWMIHLRLFLRNQKLTGFLFFIIFPVIILLMNLISLRKIYYLSGNPKIINLFRLCRLNILLIILSLIFIAMYLL